MTRRKLACLLGSAASIAGFQAPAFAQTVDNSTVPEIVVTAQRRAENQQNTSLAVTVLAGDALKDRGVRDLTNLQNVTPAFSFADAGILKFANIRGIGLNLQSPTVVSGVALYRDSLFAPSPIFLNEGVFDIASIEVLRGPQGTFVGQNSTGGAIIQHSRSPKLGSTEGNAEVSYGNFNAIVADTGVSVPLGQNLAVRLAGHLESRDSFYTQINPTNRIQPGKVDAQSARLSVLWQPATNLSVEWKTEVNANDGAGYPYTPLAGTAFAAAAPSTPFVINYDHPTKQKEFSLRTGVETIYTFDSGTKLRAVAGYQFGKQNFTNDTDATPVPFSWNDQQIHDNVYSGEINLISSDASKIKWVLGASAAYQTAQLDLGINLVGGAFVIWINTLNPKLSLGGFGQVTWPLAEGLTLDTGVRLSYDRQTQSGTFKVGGFGIDPSSPRYSDTRVTGKVALNYKVNRDNLLYAFVATGYKPGGVNLPAGLFLAETVTNYEAGWKSTLADGHLTTQLNAFYIDYKNLQLNIFNPDTRATSITNAGKSRIYGLEAQVQAHFGALRFDGSMAYVNSRVGALSLIDTRALPGGNANGLGGQCVTNSPPTPAGCFDYKPYITTLDGRKNLYSPDWTASAGIQYAVAIGDDELTPRIDLAYLAKQTTSLFERAVVDELAARTLVNAQLQFRHGSWTATAFATNLFDKTYRSGNDGDNTWYGAPRQYGVRLGVNF
jgi:iron complex outermembrane recepter protein